MFRDPLAVYRLSRDSQIEILGFLQSRNEPAIDELDPRRQLRAGDDREYHNADPTQGRGMHRPRGVVSVSTEAKERHDRFRVA